ncbi:SGNH/GDSL hydrolase family protein [Actinoalloteichus hymeniacidonis]|uniref:GDSL-like Lipase/Acylhydrolase family n=1 Tax=Actinoalloteichus hymeniacidonis TaxID=340345 RepID=A0AAC9HSS0_9PSEU|nr:SGNH/GDSL hydrolase family protein [Actinoalloteichus hymeniacidonis]AOS64763.1 GDSL-like Lipase/Acylhydrolase family [Actinoalloteichus hymeniacidonis]MBB5907161.1 lysophospholipase L1-like esterase [Actinoalloteichus hymeniacidonis]
MTDLEERPGSAATGILSTGLWEWRRRRMLAETEPVRIVWVGSSTVGGSGASTQEGTATAIVGRALGETGTHYPVTGIGGWTMLGNPEVVYADLALRSVKLIRGDEIRRTLPDSDRVTVHYMQGVGATEFTVWIDDTAYRIVPSTEGSSRRADGEWLSPLLPRADHLVRIVTEGAIIVNGAYAHRGDHGRGIESYNAGRGGTRAGSYVESAELGQMCRRLGRLDPALIVVIVGSNDYSVGISPEDYRAQVGDLMERFRTSCPRRPSFLLVQAARRSDVPIPEHPWPAYGDQLRQLAELTDDTAYLDASPHWPSGLDADSLGLLLPDRIHISAVGHRWLAELITTEVTAPIAAPSAPDSGNEPVPGGDPARLSGVISAWRAGTVTGGSGTPIARWDPHAGSQSVPLTQEAPASRPLLRPAGPGGQPYVECSREAGRWLRTADWSVAYNLPITVLSVVRQPRDTLGNVYSGRSGRYVWLGHITGQDADGYQTTGAGGTSPPNSAPVWVGGSPGWQVMAQVHAGAASRHQLYGLPPVPFVGGTVAGLPGLTLANSSTGGAGSCHDLDVAEIIVIARALSAAEVTQALNWLARWYRLDGSGRTVA